MEGNVQSPGVACPVRQGAEAGVSTRLMYLGYGAFEGLLDYQGIQNVEGVDGCVPSMRGN